MRFGKSQTNKYGRAGRFHSISTRIATCPPVFGDLTWKGKFRKSIAAFIAVVAEVERRQSAASASNVVDIRKSKSSFVQIPGVHFISGGCLAEYVLSTPTLSGEEARRIDDLNYLIVRAGATR